jgi:hypothetical protein
MPTRVVWFLGAGFSVPLGGPSLGSLLSLEAGAELALRFPESADEAGARARENLASDLALVTRWLHH